MTGAPTGVPTIAQRVQALLAANRLGEALVPMRQLTVAMPAAAGGLRLLAGLEVALKRIGDASRRFRWALAIDPADVTLIREALALPADAGVPSPDRIRHLLVQEPDLLLMDEPFAALDPILRDNLNVNLLKLWQRRQKTILFVTHSINEAVFLSDRIVILEEGRFLKEFTVDIPRPRDFETFSSKTYLDMVRELRTWMPI